MPNTYFDQELVGSGLARSNRAALDIVLANPRLHGRSQAILFLSDSTGREPSLVEGFLYLFAQRCAADNAALPVIVQAWDPTNQVYGGKTNLNPAAEDRHLLMLAPDATAQTRSLTNAEIGTWTDLDLRLDIAADDWTPSATASLCGQWGGAGTYGHRLRLLSTGGLRYEWSNDGTAINTANSTATLGFADGARRMIRVTHDINNGASGNTVTFWHKTPEADTWTQLGSPVVTAGVTTIARPSARQFELGGTGSTSIVPGKYYGIEYLDNINGGYVSPQPVECWRGNEDKTVTAGAPTLYVFIGAQGGAALNAANNTNSGFLEAARWPKMVPLFQCISAMVLNTGHNEQDNGAAWLAQLDTWLTAARLRQPTSTMWLMNQQPRLDAVAPVHARRMGLSEAWARRNGIGLIDSYDYWCRQPNIAGLLQGDRLHPNAAGAQISADAVGAVLT